MENHCRNNHIPAKPRSKNGASSSSRNGGFPALPTSGDNAETNTLESFCFPPGYRFCPQDHELINDYLAKRSAGEKLPANSFIDVNIYDHHPETLARKFMHADMLELYCFSPRERKYKNGERPNRGACGGYWKATGADKDVHFGEKTVGHKKSLVFYDGKPPNGVKSNWILHEYRLTTASYVPAKRRYPNTMQLDDCVLCKIYMKVGRKLVLPAQLERQVDDRADVKIENSLQEKETENVYLPVEISTDDSVEDYGFNPSSSDEYQHYSMASYNHNPFLHQSGHIYPDTRYSPPLPLQMSYLPPLPLQISYGDQSGSGFSHQELGTSSSLNLSTSPPEFHDPYFSDEQKLEAHFNHTMPAKFFSGPHVEGFSANRNHASPLGAAAFDASTFNEFHARGFEADTPSSSYNLQENFNMGRWVDLPAISPMLFPQNDHYDDADQPVNTDIPSAHQFWSSTANEQK